MSRTFSQRVIAWHAHSGRKNLPWQQPITPYRVWVSEIMLQQTQVGTVIDYFNRFMQLFPTVNDLAAASIDEVLQLWAGLGYYARARNLHRSAQLIRNQHNGKLPENLEQLTALPGIGRSTAGAILSLAYQQPHAILDGNVKRVLTRHFAISGYPEATQVKKQLWVLAESLLPKQQSHTYTQAMMDLGATLCTKTNPACTHCPLTKSCKARKNQTQANYPEKKPKKTKPLRHTTFILFYCEKNNVSHILLQQRPETGIWGGLWSAPEYQATPTKLSIWCQQQFKLNPIAVDTQSSFVHQFTHFNLEITPIVIKVSSRIDISKPRGKAKWFTLDHPLPGVPAPLRKLLDTLDIPIVT